MNKNKKILKCAHEMILITLRLDKLYGREMTREKAFDIFRLSRLMDKKL